MRLEDAGMVRFERNQGFRVQQPGVRDLQEVFQIRLMLEVPATYNAARRITEKTLGQLQGELNAMKQIAQKSAQLREELDGMRRNAQEDPPRPRSTSAATADELQAELRRLDLEFVEHDTAFHELVLKAGGNERLVDLVRSLRAIVTSIGAWNLHQGRSLEETRAEHEPVLVALQRGDARQAAQKMHRHLTSTGDLLLRHMSEDQASYDPSWDDCVAIPLAPAPGTGDGTDEDAPEPTSSQRRQ